jgi:CheY-like chemotaxis protein
VHHIKGDAPRLQQVLVNLVSNAIKFTNQGQVTVSITEQDINKQQIYLQFSVSDTGVGIAKDVQETIFTAFSQADNSIARRYGGTGLGLSISRQLVKLMGGDISLSSEIGKGSCFSFGLTFDIALEVDNNAIVTNPTLEIIIADDNQIARHALVSISQILGMQAIALESGQAVLDYVLTRNRDKQRQEIIILDWQMPDMDGLQTAKLLYENSHTANNKPIIIMVTAYQKKLLNQHPEITQLFNAVLSKPVTASSLYDAITKALHKQQKTEYQKIISNGLPLIKRLEGIKILIVDDNDTVKSN